jgi:phosphoribosylanthranilate isomerase
VKICGITRPEDASAAAMAGADAIGLVFHPASPRHVTVERAREIVAATPAFVTVTGLFLDPPERAVSETLESVALDLLQFHGGESPAFCERFERRYLKAVPRDQATNAPEWAQRYASAAGLLFDSHTAGSAGGSGRTFDWSRLPRELSLPLILAGGLRPDNVGRAVRQVRPWGVDVSSGVEARTGVKDDTLMQRFVREVQDQASDDYAQ